MIINPSKSERQTDVAVVGGGPAGSTAALNIAKLGLRVTVFEEHSEIGVPSHCAGHLSIRSLSNLGLYPLPGRIIENTFSRANFYSSTGSEFSVHLAKPVTCAVDRAAFDKYIAEKAQKEGANYSLNSRVQSLIIRNNNVTGVTLRPEGHEPDAEVTSKIVVDAEGISSRILRQARLPSLNPPRLAYAVEAEVENVKNVENDAVEVFLGQGYAPGFYAWLIPRLDGTAKVGLATRTGDPREFLRRLMHKHPIGSRQLNNARIMKTSFHSITLGGPITRSYSNGFLAVGDAASQVKPTTGGGVILGLTCAKIAAEVAGDAIKTNDFSSNYLRAYQERCNSALGFDIGVMLRIRKILDTLSDDNVDKVIRFCSRIGLDKALENVDEIDFQGQAFLKILNKPTVYSVMAYLISLYLLANA
jgi:digeranylgeranylglycerophospholipid reductase